MNKKKSNIYSIIALIGIAIWMIVYPIREANLNLNPILNFLIGTAPSFGAAICYPFLLLSFTSGRKTTKLPEFQILLISTSIVFILITVMEVIHPLLGGSPLDMGDLIMTIVGIALDFVIYLLIAKRNCSTKN